MPKKTLGSSVGLLAGILVALGPAAVSAADADEHAKPRSFERFELDAQTADGLWFEFSGRSDMDGDDSFGRDLDLDLITLLLRIAYGFELGEVGVRIPYLFAENNANNPNNEIDNDDIGDIRLYGKLLAIRTERLNAGIGFDLSVPTGDEDDGLGSGELGFLPYATAALDLWYGAVQMHVGYQEFATTDNAPANDAWIYGGSIHAFLQENVTLRADFVGKTVDRDQGRTPDVVTLEPGLDIHMPLGKGEIILRPMGVFGLTDEAPNWGFGFGVSLRWKAPGT